MSKHKKLQPAAFGNRQSFCSLRNASADEAVIYIYDEIGGWGIWASEFIALLSRISASVIRVRIHSPGGFVDEAIAIHNALRKHKAHIITEVDSIAASAASFIVQAGDERVIAENARMMIHDLGGIVWGSEDDIRAYADHMIVARESVIATYDYRTNINADEIRDILLAGTDFYMDAEKAVDLGFADRIENLADMGEPPADLGASTPTEPDQASNSSRMDFDAELRELNQLYGLTAKQSVQNSGGSGHRDQGQEETNMDITAQLKQAGYENITDLITDRDKARTERDTAQASLEESATKLTAANGQIDDIKAVHGEHTLETVGELIESGETFRSAMVNEVVAMRRHLKMLEGDDEAAVTEATAAVTGMPFVDMKAEHVRLSKATAGMKQSQFHKKPGAPEDTNQDSPVQQILNSGHKAGLKVIQGGQS